MPIFKMGFRTDPVSSLGQQLVGPFDQLHQYRRIGKGRILTG
jgi:hypothetical protein